MPFPDFFVLNKFLIIMRYPQFLITCWASLIFTTAIHAAPLDALLSADHAAQGTFQAEAGYDVMNGNLDVFRLRANDPRYAGSNVGDYQGQHVRLAYALTDNFALDAISWRRAIHYRSDIEALNSWQLAAQYQFIGDVNSSEHFAVRLSGWGNQADVLTKSTPTQMLGRNLNRFTVQSPQDKQLQLDGITTWRLSENFAASGFMGFGKSIVSTGDMSANYTNASGCNYNLAFTAAGTSGVLAAPCVTPNLLITSFTTPQQVLSEFSYTAHYYQLGGMAQWQQSAWMLRMGYQFQYLKRDNVDALIRSRGGVSYQTNHVVLFDVARRINPHLSLFMRGQLMSNQFVGEIPFAYNTATASKFGQRYGFATLGARVDF